MRGPDSRAEMAGAARRALTSNSAGFLPLCVSPSHSFWRTDDDVVCLAAEGGREEAATAEAANDGHGIIGNGQCQPALPSLSITATSLASHSIKVEHFPLNSQFLSSVSLPLWISVSSTNYPTRLIGDEKGCTMVRLIRVN